MATEFDHIVLGCTDLESGTAWVSDRLEAGPDGGGSHEFMGTHNKLWGLGGSYIELIAINPEAPNPGRPRWFGLDNVEVQTRLNSGPRLLTYALRVDDLDAALAAAPVPFGEPIIMSRGDNRWRVTVPADGDLRMEGQLPALLEWQTPSPGNTLPDGGRAFSRLKLWRSEATILQRTFDAIGAGHLVSLEGGAMTAGMTAEIMTPEGALGFSS